MNKPRALRIFLVIAAMMLVSVLIPAMPAMAAGNITITAPAPATGPVGTAVSMTGAGFLGANYTIRYDGVALKTAALAAGGFADTFVVPASARGAHTVTVTTDGPDTSNSLTFTVTPKVALTLVTGNTGDTVGINGTGYGASVTVSVTFAATAITNLITDATGSFATSFIIPEKPAGGHAVTATDTASNTATTAFTITPRISLNQVLVASGSSVTVTGNGFAASVSVTVSVDGVAKGTTFTGTSGAFSMSLTIPTAAGGSHIITAVDGFANAANTGYTITASVTITPATMQGGNQATVAGAGFSPNIGVFVYIDGTVAATPGSDTVGSFSTTVSVPRLPAGSHTVSATDSLGRTASRTFTITPSVSVTPTSAPGGSQVALTGHGFAGSAAISVLVDNATISGATGTTDETGSFAIAGVTLPEVAGGIHVLKAQDTSGNSATVNVTITQVIAIAPLSGPPGTSVKVSGKSFIPGRAISINFDGVRLTNAPGVSGTDGTFNISVIVPPGKSGSHTIAVTDGTSTSNATFTMTSKADINPKSGTVGGIVTVTGSGYTVGETVKVKFGSVEVASATADNNGSFTTTFSVPATQSGSSPITVDGGGESAPFTFTTSAGVKLDQASGFVGGTVTVFGTGFKAGATATVTYDGAQVATAQVDATGGFSTTFKAPTSRAGDHTVSVTDGASTALSKFVMDSAAPPAPTLTTPLDTTRTGSNPTFAWAEATDDSGVTYTLQVASDRNFTTGLIEKKGLTDTSYQFTTEEKLERNSKDRPFYYWRVRATDGASNQGDWSPAQTLFVGMATSVVLLFVAIGVVAAAAIALGVWFVLRKRMAVGP